MALGRDRWRGKLAAQIAARPEAFDDAALAAPALVFAAHAHDEALACGGTIAKKTGAGGSVRIVVVTEAADSPDGASSPQFAEMRRAEALHSASVLGVTPEAVRLLEFEDGRLAQAGGALLDAIGSILLRERPEQLFVPWRHDGHTDHEATFRAVVRAARGVSLACDVYEYPTWAWRHWPWVRLRLPGEDARAPWQATAKFAGGWRFTRIFAATSHIDAVLERKRAALASYGPRLDPDGTCSPASVGRGDFLRVFDQPYEVFRRGRLRR